MYNLQRAATAQNLREGGFLKPTMLEFADVCCSELQRSWHLTMWSGRTANCASPLHTKLSTAPVDRYSPHVIQTCWKSCGKNSQRKQNVQLNKPTNKWGVFLQNRQNQQFAQRSALRWNNTFLYSFHTQIYKFSLKAVTGEREREHTLQFWVMYDFLHCILIMDHLELPCFEKARFNSLWCHAVLFAAKTLPLPASSINRPTPEYTHAGEEKLKQTPSYPTIFPSLLTTRVLWGSRLFHTEHTTVWEYCNDLNFLARFLLFSTSSSETGSDSFQNVWVLQRISVEKC